MIYFLPFMGSVTKMHYRPAKAVFNLNKDSR